MLRGSNLTDRGRDQARTIGEAIRALAIPIGPYCSDIGSQSSRCPEGGRWRQEAGRQPGGDRRRSEV